MIILKILFLSVIVLSIEFFICVHFAANFGFVFLLAVTSLLAGSGSVPMNSNYGSYSYATTTTTTYAPPPVYYSQPSYTTQAPYTTTYASPSYYTEPPKWVMFLLMTIWHLLWLKFNKLLSLFQVLLCSSQLHDNLRPGTGLLFATGLHHSGAIHDHHVRTNVS